MVSGLKKFSVVFLILLSGCINTNVSWQNDVVGGTDNNFTNGFQISHRSDKPMFESIDGKIPVPRILDNDPTKTAYYIFSLDQNIYTPDNLRAHEVVENQNPYAGTLTLGEEKVLLSDDQKISARIRLGSSGKYSYAGQTQMFVHDTLTDWGRPQTHPNGWDNQVDGEPLFNYDYERSKEDGRIKVLGLDLANKRTTLVRLGNIQTDLTGKYGFRFGENVPRFNSVAEKKLAVFLLSDAFAVGRARNIYYDGGIFKDSVHTVDKEYLVYGLENGVEVRYNNLTLKFLYNVQSRDYTEQANSIHSFGWLSLGSDW